ncbi:unnamed protein product [Nezara viridula]|uniref:Uncharacterized protein n=1 Tax=Nezara viridula TaxID=85310 RepID=A0A9P0E9U5_NEZVI|nr:unnamed protein product [Nezara viridula]
MGSAPGGPSRGMPHSPHPKVGNGDENIDERPGFGVPKPWNGDE